MLSSTAKMLLAGVCLCALSAAAGPPGVWLDVPFIQQEKKGCGAASIAMVMQYWARQQKQSTDTIDVVEIQRTLYSKEGHGIYASDVERYFQSHGFRTFSFKGVPSDLRQHLEKGRPLMVALKPLPRDNSLHFVVVTGLDWENRIVMVNDPAQRKLLKVNQSDFEQEWSATGKWTLLALPQPEAR
jgi:ABC-type bacteriocin/lantibiotic exporter with double-glycine peptidase domain